MGDRRYYIPFHRTISPAHAEITTTKCENDVARRQIVERIEKVNVAEQYIMLIIMNILISIFM
jgi:hypothetical protein